MKKEIRVCDLCNKDIPEDNSGSGMILPDHSYQVWDVGDARNDVCHSCCLVLSVARSRGFIDFKDDPFFERANFKKKVTADGRVAWEAPSFLELYGDSE